ncbi:MAG: PaaI family thioesterase [Pseudohongiellaceae bacterium]
MSKKYKPTDYGIESHYQHWHGDRAEDTVGPFFYHMDGDRARTAFRAEDRHANTLDSIHGGILMTFADYTLCLAANNGRNESVVTVTQNCEFTAPAKSGDIIRGEAEVVRRGRSLVFVRSILYSGDTPVMNASAVVKLIKPK